MYAVVETGGKQYRVAPGEFVDVERLPAEVGEQIILDRVLLVAEDEQVLVGQPALPGAQVIATVAGQRRHRKVIIFHYRAKKRERKKRGHRQYYTRLRIEQIQV
jgi:large subunit ribosomal protein L21